MKRIATNYMQEAVSDLSYDFKKMLESCLLLLARGAGEAQEL
jgi:hypothetical protein